MATTIQVGQRVEAGKRGTRDYDTGRVVSVDVDAGTATIAWDSGVRTDADSHRAAGNFGVYPHNGAERFVMPRVEAQEVVDSDEDGYDRIVRTATEKDIRHYGTTRRPEGW